MYTCIQMYTNVYNCIQLYTKYINVYIHVYIHVFAFDSVTALQTHALSIVSSL